MELEFYTRPFYLLEDTDFVFDYNDNFIFEFDEYISDFDKNIIIESLNSEDFKPYTQQEMYYNSSNAEVFLSNTKISIRGWGNLTGIEANHFPFEKAKRIQDTLAKFLIYKLTDYTK